MDIKNRFAEKLRNKRPVFFLLGALVTQSLVFAAFSIKSVRYSIPVLESFDTTYSPFDFDSREIYREPPKPAISQTPISLDPFSIKNIYDNTDVELSEDEKIKNNLTLLHIINTGISPEIIKDDDEIIAPISFDPEFPGGEKAMYQFIKDNFVYPEYAKRIELEGMLMMVFVIDKDGYIKEVSVDSKTRTLGYGLEEEAVRVLSIMPKWKPGFVNNRSVDRVFKIPFHITLDMSN